MADALTWTTQISTNIGATLILVNIIYDTHFTSTNSSPRVQYGALFAIAVGSNIGAYSFVFPASLAGLLWRGKYAQTRALSTLAVVELTFTLL